MIFTNVLEQHSVDRKILNIIPTLCVYVDVNFTSHYISDTFSPNDLISIAIW